MKFRCKVHMVSLNIEGNRRTIELPPGSWGENCKLLTLKDPKPGKYANCEIEKVE